MFQVTKILEKVVTQQLCSYFESCQRLSPFQGAYRRGKSTEQLLLVAVDRITQALDITLITCVAFWILHKVFDSLDHHILLLRLHKVAVLLTGLSAISLVAIRELNFIIPIPLGDWLQVKYLKAVPWILYYL